MAKRFAPRTEEAAGRHRCRTSQEGPHRHRAPRRCQWSHLLAEGETEVYEGEAEERDVPEPIHPARVARVAAQPVLAMEEQPHDRPAGEAEQEPEPGEREIEMSGFVHGARLVVRHE